MSDKHDEIAQKIVAWQGLQPENLALRGAFASALRQVEREMEIKTFAAKVSAKAAHAYATQLEELVKAALAAWETKQEQYPSGNTIREEMIALRTFLSPTPTESATELPTTQELADVSTPVKLIDREQWQPIETAPKDGTEILGWRGDAGVMLIRYLAPIDFLTERELEKLDEESAETSDWFYADFVEGGRLEGREIPTHWTPQPTGPIQAAPDGTRHLTEREQKVMDRALLASVKIVDDGYVRVPIALLDACKTSLQGKEHRDLVKWIEQAAEKGE